GGGAVGGDRRLVVLRPALHLGALEERPLAEPAVVLLEGPAVRRLGARDLATAPPELTGLVVRARGDDRLALELRGECLVVGRERTQPRGSLVALHALQAVDRLPHRRESLCGRLARLRGLALGLDLFLCRERQRPEQQ